MQHHTLHTTIIVPSGLDAGAAVRHSHMAHRAQLAVIFAKLLIYGGRWHRRPCSSMRELSVHNTILLFLKNIAITWLLRRLELPLR